jgi:hypothetical protein
MLLDRTDPALPPGTAPFIAADISDIDHPDVVRLTDLELPGKMVMIIFLLMLLLGLAVELNLGAGQHRQQVCLSRSFA